MVLYHRKPKMYDLESELASSSLNQLQAAGLSGDPIDRLRMVCLSHGATGILVLGRMFRRMDGDGTTDLNEAEFLHCLQNSGLAITEEEAHDIFHKFDAQHRGWVNIDEFMNAIRPPMSESRKQIIEKAFDKMDKTGDGILTPKDLKRGYNVKQHPLYDSGEESEETIFSRFMAHFDKGAPADGHVTREEFSDFYAAISASIDTDCYFDLLMRQCYKL